MCIYEKSKYELMRFRSMALHTTKMQYYCILRSSRIARTRCTKAVARELLPRRLRGLNLFAKKKMQQLLCITTIIERTKMGIYIYVKKINYCQQDFIFRPKISSYYT